MIKIIATLFFFYLKIFKFCYQKVSIYVNVNTFLKFLFFKNFRFITYVFILIHFYARWYLNSKNIIYYLEIFTIWFFFLWLYYPNFLYYRFQYLYSYKILI